MTTLTTLYRKTLENLEVVAADIPADASDVQLIAGRYRNVYDMLVTEGLVAWALTDDIPDYAEIPLMNLLSRASAKAFGQNPQVYEAEAEAAMPTLRRQLAKRYVSSTAQSEYF